MKGIAIYMEGGGEKPGGKIELRQGMDSLLGALKDAARSKALRWKLVPCGSRKAAFSAFSNAINSGDDAFVVLLVDSEEPVSDRPNQHLALRDKWDLAFADEDAVHLMVEVMETWIIADADALATYYGQGFRRNALPRRENLENVSKRDVEHSLNRATEHTTKGRYHKIKHASDLLQRIDVSKVRRRCRHCERLFNAVTKQIEAA